MNIGNSLKILSILYLLLVFSLLRNFNYLKNVERTILVAEIDCEEKNNENTSLDREDFFLEGRLFKEIGKIIDFIKNLVLIISKINECMG